MNLLLYPPVHPAIHRTVAKPPAHRLVTKPAHHATGPKTGSYGLYDSATPGATPNGLPQAIYANGAYSRPGSAAQGHKSTLWIDVNGSNPNADVLDVEPGNVGPSTAGPWAAASHKAHPRTPVIIYTMKSAWPAVKASVAKHHMHVKYWVADPTQNPHNLKGADATQWHWGKTLDISSTTTNFWRK